MSYLNDKVEKLFDDYGDNVKEGVDAAAAQPQDNEVEEAVGVQGWPVEHVGLLKHKTPSRSSTTHLTLIECVHWLYYYNLRVARNILNVIIDMFILC